LANASHRSVVGIQPSREAATRRNGKSESTK
jgi:hypothetical protein